MEGIRNLKIRTRCLLADGEYIWFVPEETGVLCRYHVIREMVDYMCVVPKEVEHRSSYATMVKYGEKIVLIPYIAQEVAIFDTSSENFTQIKLPDAGECYLHNAKFDDGIVVGRYLYMIPGKFPYIVKMDLHTYETWQSEDMYRLCKCFFNKTVTELGVSVSTWDRGKFVYVGISVLSGREEHIGLCKIDLETLKIEITTVPYVEAWMKGLVWDKDRLYIYSAEGKITILDSNMNYLESLFDQKLCDYDHPSNLNIAFSYIMDKKIYFIRCLGLEMVIIDVKNNNMVTKRKIMEQSIICAGEVQGGIWLQTEEIGGVYIWKDGNFIRKRLNVSSFEIQNCFRGLVETAEGVFLENPALPLQDWLELACQKRENLLLGYEQNRGSRIYKYVI